LPEIVPNLSGAVSADFVFRLAPLLHSPLPSPPFTNPDGRTSDGVRKKDTFKFLSYTPDRVNKTCTIEIVLGDFIGEIGSGCKLLGQVEVEGDFGAHIPETINRTQGTVFTE
jgi:hypothetical protein